jgi:hypothetical protein
MVKEKRRKPDRIHTTLPYGLGNPYRNLKSENSQNYAQKPQQNCTFMFLASVFAEFKNVVDQGTEFQEDNN